MEPPNDQFADVDEIIDNNLLDIQRQDEVVTAVRKTVKEEFKGLKEELKEAIQEALKEGLAPLAAEIKNLKDSVESLKDCVEGLKDTVEGLKDTVEGLKDTVEGLSKGFDGIYGIRGPPATSALARVIHDKDVAMQIFTMHSPNQLIFAVADYLKISKDDDLETTQRKLIGVRKILDEQFPHSFDTLDTRWESTVRSCFKISKASIGKILSDWKLAKYRNFTFLFEKTYPIV